MCHIDKYLCLFWEIDTNIDKYEKKETIEKKILHKIGLLANLDDILFFF